MKAEAAPATCREESHPPQFFKEPGGCPKGFTTCAPVGAYCTRCGRKLGSICDHCMREGR